MSMLSERKRKQKWSLNPQGNLWSKGSNTIGQKLLERMGWSEGKGLGRNEDGQTSHVKVSYKNDTNGMGYKETDESSVHQDDFDTLLKELSNSNGSDFKKPQELKSLEEKSQNSRARVHYRKFTRGKDLSQYSEKDLANIFGKKKLTAEAAVEVDNDCMNGSNTIAGGSMTDYFKRKMPNFKKYNGFGFSTDDNVENIAGGSMIDYYKSEIPNLQKFSGFGFNTSDNVENKAEEEAGADENAAKSKKKKKESKTTFVSYVYDEVATNLTSKKKKREHPLEELEESVPKKQKTDKSKKFKSEDCLEDLGLINPAFEPLNSNITVKKHILDTITENDELETTHTEETSKTKKKKSRKDKLNQSLNSQDEFKESTEEAIDIVTKKSKKLKRKVNSQEDTPQMGLINPAFELLNNSMALENDICNASTENSNAEYDMPKENPKKKKKKSKCAQDGIENPSFSINDDNSEEPIAENPFEEKTKKKKKKKQNSELGLFAIDNPTFDVSNDLESVIPSQEYEVTRKGKKKSKGLDNPALNLDDSNAPTDPKDVQSEGNSFEISECDIMINVVDEPIKAASTPKLGKASKKYKSVRFSQVNQQRIITEYTSPDDVGKRNELFDINTKVIQDGLRDLKKGKHSPSTANQAFDIKSVDKIDFCDDGSSKPFRIHRKMGRDNQCFDASAQRMEESINQLSNNIDRYQAEVENGINESKVRQTYQERMIGEIAGLNEENEVHDEGLTLRFRYAKFQSRVPHWLKSRDASATMPKKSYKHLIRGDIVLGFMNTNLHQIDGYGKK